MKIAFTIFAAITFLVYVYIALYLLFFGRPWLGGSGYFSLAEYFRFNSNFIPFAEISREVGEVIRGTPSAGMAGRNLLGNTFLLAPMGFYFPYFWRKMLGLKIYIFSIVVLIVAVEAVQLVTRSGVVDIDDFILNFAGALLGFAVCKYTPIRHLFKYRAY